jgi:hypothetical protein
VVVLFAGLALAVPFAFAPPVFALLQGQAALVAAASILGCVAAGAAAGRLGQRLPRVPPGDLLFLLDALLWRGVGLWERFGDAIARLRDRSRSALARAGVAMRRYDFAGDGEALLGRWSTAMLLLLVMAAVAAWFAGLV